MRRLRPYAVLLLVLDSAFLGLLGMFGGDAVAAPSSTDAVPFHFVVQTEGGCGWLIISETDDWFFQHAPSTMTCEDLSGAF